MRVIYSTPRLENAERVTQLLEDRGIGVRLLYGPHHRRRSWRGSDYGQASNPGDWPRVLVLNNGDLPMARDALRELGLMAPTAFERLEADPEGAPVFRGQAPAPGLATTPALARRIRLALMVVLLVLVVVQVGHYLLSAGS